MSGPLRLAASHFRRAATALLALAVWGLVWVPWLVGMAVLVGWWRG